MKQLSILIPTYNDLCAELAAKLQQQASEAGIGYEIIVADDGSTSLDVITANRAINKLPHCRVEERGVNSGRAAIRNFLAKQAKYEWLLFIDSDMVVKRQDFIRRYAAEDSDVAVVDGGVEIGETVKGNLRALYEKTAEQKHTAQQRQKTPYQHIHTANLLVRRDIMLRHPFDERFRHYGYEDVFFGKQLHENHIPILHIDNPLSFEKFEPNDQFIGKTEEGLQTLYHFRHELQNYSNLLTIAQKLRRITPLIRLWHRLNHRWERHLLTSPHPNLPLFNLYRLGYFLSMK